MSIVSEMTGYPPELLDLDLDLEADLGVDTVKQAEVFAAVRERFGVERDEHLKLRDFPTLNHVVGWITDKVAGTLEPDALSRHLRARKPPSRADATGPAAERRSCGYRPLPAAGSGACPAAEPGSVQADRRRARQQAAVSS